MNEGEEVGDRRMGAYHDERFLDAEDRVGGDVLVAFGVEGGDQFVVTISLNSEDGSD